MRAVGIGRWLSLIVLFGLGASGCSESTRQTEPSIVIDTLPGGAVRVTSQGDGDWSLDDAGWSLDPELRIGSLEGEHDAFARIEAVELLSDGRIVVLDRGAHTVTVFDSSGGHLSSFGGDGDGLLVTGNPLHGGLTSGSVHRSSAQRAVSRRLPLGGRHGPVRPGPAGE